MTESRKTALVTGAASGIGLALSKHLLSRGYNVALCDINAEAGRTHMAELGENAIFIQNDATSYEDQVKAFEQLWATWGRLDFVAANAGIGDSVDFYGSLSSSGTPAKPNLRTIDVNLTAVLFTVYLAQHYLARNPAGGKITITASSAALYPIPFAPLYGASKSAIPGLVRSMASKLQESNIAINCICPGMVPTALTDAIVKIIPKDKITPFSTVMKAHDRFLDGNEAGCAAEISVDKIYLRDHVPFADKEQEWICTAVPTLGVERLETPV
ncbi:hypothetical protein RBB50_000259 [Rhinocladiella similis]